MKEFYLSLLVVHWKCRNAANPFVTNFGFSFFCHGM